jgi:hypothetical protein
MRLWKPVTGCPVKNGIVVLVLLKIRSIFSLLPACMKAKQEKKTKDPKASGHIQK